MPNGKLKTAADAAASGRTEASARLERFRKDLASWFGARHASGSFGIISSSRGREVARFEKREDQLATLAAVRLSFAVGPAITALAFAEEGYARSGDAIAFSQTKAAKDALIAGLEELEKSSIPETIEGTTR